MSHKVDSEMDIFIQADILVSAPKKNWTHRHFIATMSTIHSIYKKKTEIFSACTLLVVLRKKNGLI